MALPQNVELFNSTKQAEHNTNSTKRPEKVQDDHSFHVVIAPVIAIAQFFGLFPVVCVFNKKVEKIRFKFLSVRTVHAIMMSASSMVFTILEVFHLVNLDGLNPKNINGVIFYIICVVNSLFFLRLAQCWSSILAKFVHVDKLFQRSNYIPHHARWSLRKRTNMAAALFLIIAFLEHLSAWVNFLYERIYQSSTCHWQIESWFYYIATTHLPQIYSYFPVRWTTVLWAEYMNVALTFAWNFADLFIIVTSLAIAFKYETINYRLEHYQAKEKRLDEDYWENVRLHYNEVCDLQEFLDDKIGYIVCVACLNDLYFVTLQLLNLATPFPFFINHFYFWWSMMCLLARTFSMLLITSAVHEESKKPLKVLRHIHNDGWFSETQRFSHQVQTSCFAMTGKKFFKITRGIIITIAGTILTYELVLLQFGADEIITGLFHPCPKNEYAKNDKNGT